MAAARMYSLLDPHHYYLTTTWRPKQTLAGLVQCFASCFQECVIWRLLCEVSEDMDQSDGSFGTRRCCWWVGI